MGLVLRFPLERRKVQRLNADLSADDCQVLVLPVVQVERHDAEAPDARDLAPVIAGTPRRGGDKPRGGRKSA
ncbi:hypothetical protein [Phreatobacter stygius]|uniref:Uncharacterized protein n=1 Tax=Phreatobacter stygius TaxID=1940610 RepID=A0A4D7B7Z2_9HYPH|nr:hypothetical protein [Phreatobacter stygius]QCI66520.1 hypothetical protein E8M01_21180 [Phreatobacter stygius]